MVTLAAAPLLAVLGAFALQQAPEQTRQPVGDGLYVITGQGGNILFSTGADGTFVVDDQFDRVADANLRLIEEVSDGPVVFVLNTHHHGDHSGGNAAFTAAGGTVVATERVRARLAEADPDADGLPVLTFSDAMTFHWNGDTIRAVSLRDAHTDGDAMVYLEQADVLHTGDILFAKRFPFIDVSSGGSIDGMIGALQRILDVAGPDTIIVPGHGPVGDEATVEDSLAMLRRARALVMARIEAGDDREAAIAAKPLAELDAYSWRFIDADRMVGQTYDSLVAAREKAARERAAVIDASMDAVRRANPDMSDAELEAIREAAEEPVTPMSRTLTEAKRQEAAAGQPDAGAALDAPPARPAAPETEAADAETDDLNEAQLRRNEEADAEAAAPEPAPQPADPVSPAVPTPNRGG